MNIRYFSLSKEIIVLVVISFLFVYLILKHSTVVEGNEETSPETSAEEVEEITSINLDECKSIDDELDVRRCGIRLYAKLIQEHNKYLMKSFTDNIKPDIETKQKEPEYKDVQSIPQLYDIVTKQYDYNNKPSRYKSFETKLKTRQEIKLKMIVMLKELYGLEILNSSYITNEIDKSAFLGYSDTINAMKEIEFSSFNDEIVGIAFNIILSNIYDNEEKLLGDIMDKTGTKANLNGNDVFRFMRGVDVNELKKKTSHYNMILKYDYEFINFYNNNSNERISSTGKNIKITDDAMVEAANLFGTRNKLDSIQVKE